MSSLEQLVPRVMYELFAENCELRKITNSYQLRLLAMQRDLRPSQESSLSVDALYDALVELAEQSPYNGV